MTFFTKPRNVNDRQVIRLCVVVPRLGDVDLDTVGKLKWNGITFKKGSKLWRVFDSVVLIGLYNYELAYLINNSNKQAIILEMEGEKE